MIGRMLAFHLSIPFKLKFYSPFKDGRWYVDYPDYPGPFGHLEMVAGADEFCENIWDDMMIDPHEHDHKFTVFAYNKQGNRGPSSYKLELISTNASIWAGRFYEVYRYTQNLKWERTQTIWLCPVMLYTFGCYPKELYIWRE